jgi:hypothetical protein
MPWPSFFASWLLTNDVLFSSLVSLSLFASLPPSRLLSNGNGNATTMMASGYQLPFRVFLRPFSSFSCTLPNGIYLHFFFAVSLQPRRKRSKAQEEAGEEEVPKEEEEAVPKEEEAEE